MIFPCACPDCGRMRENCPSMALGGTEINSSGMSVSISPACGHQMQAPIPRDVFTPTQEAEALAIWQNQPSTNSTVQPPLVPATSELVGMYLLRAQIVVYCNQLRPIQVYTTIERREKKKERTVRQGLNTGLAGRQLECRQRNKTYDSFNR